MKEKTRTILCAVFAALLVSCGKKEPRLAPEPEVLSVFWENATLSMDVGETRLLKWISSRIIRPRIHCEGSAVVITGMAQDGVYIRAFESGTDIISLNIEEQEIICVVTVNEDMSGFIGFVTDEDEPDEIDETGLQMAADDKPVNIIVPYIKEYLSIGQETKITVRLENGAYGDEMHFKFTKEPGKNSIELDSVYNAATIKAVGEGEQYIRISHPKAPAGKLIVYDVLPPAPPPPPKIDVSESPMIMRKGETKPLQMILLNGNSGHEKFQFQVVENAYAIEVKQHGNILNVTGIAPGAGKIRITNPSAASDYDVMVIVD